MFINMFDKFDTKTCANLNIYQVKIEDELEEYKDLEPGNAINVCKNREKYVHFFDNWSPDFEDFGEKIPGPSKPVSHKLTMKDIDTRAKEVYTLIGYNKE